MPTKYYISHSDLSNLKGIWLYDDAVNYAENQIVLDPTDGILYRCRKAIITGTDTPPPSPHADTNHEYWEPVTTETEFKILETEPSVSDLAEDEIAFVAPTNVDSAFVILTEEPTTSTLAEGQIAFVVEA